MEICWGRKKLNVYYLWDKIEIKVISEKDLLIIRERIHKVIYNYIFENLGDSFSVE